MLVMSKNPKFEAIKRRTSDNEIEILKSKTCSCLFCRQTYDARKVSDWVNDERGVTAICPECGMDAVVGDGGGEPLSHEELKELNLAYYGEDYMEKHPAAAATYVSRYQEGKISHHKKNESLYIQYLSLLSKLNWGDATYKLAELYEFGDEFTEKDPAMAFSYYASENLASDGRAYDRMGLLWRDGALGKVDEKAAFVAFSKGMALGDYGAMVHYIDCYAGGIFVPEDVDFAVSCLLKAYDDLLTGFILSKGADGPAFPMVAYRLGQAYTKNSDASGWPAIKFFLLAELGYKKLQESGALKGELKEEYEDTKKELSAIAKAHDFERKPPVFDNDTFGDTFLEMFSDRMPVVFNPIAFTPLSFDKDQGVFEFETKGSIPLLIIDITDLYCDFVDGTIHWFFTEVRDAKFGRPDFFTAIDGNGDEGYSFYNTALSQTKTVCTVDFYPPAGKDEGGAASPKDEKKDASKKA
jgi:TPR repeat protein